jgi:hypothetical protein
MRAILATVGQTEVSDERLADKLAAEFEHARNATAALAAIRMIAALRTDSPFTQEHTAKALEAAIWGDRAKARRHLSAAREAAEAAAAEARRLARQAEAAMRKQMLAAARAISAEAELALKAQNYSEAARLFGEAASLTPDEEQEERDALLRRKTEAALCQERSVAEG